MTIKKLKIDLNLKKIACADTFDVKQASTGISIEGFANKATVDRGDEMISTDAWELDNFKRNPIILFNHGMDTLGGTPVGRATEIKQTPEGLYLKVKMSNSNAPGIAMVRGLVEERILKAFSVGFNPKQMDTVQIDGKSIKKITKAELFEVSIVGVPMNQDSLFELSEKSLTTKSFHQLKGEILKAKQATKAQEIEELLAQSPCRKDVIAEVAKSQKLEHSELLDMLAGDTDIPDAVIAAFPLAIKQVDLKLVLEEALSALDAGADQSAVLAELTDKLKEPSDEEKPADPPADPAQGSKEETAGQGETDPAAQDPATQEGDPKAGKEDPKLKADFQSCVNEMVPMLVAEGKPQDEAVAMAIAKCQEQGKCQLTPASKLAVYGEVFVRLAAGDLVLVESEVIAFKAGSAVKDVSQEAQGDQAPTTPVKTDPSENDFGSPFLEAANQTNVLLGALINEIQKLSSKMDGLTNQSSLQSSQDTSKVSDATTDALASASNDHAEKRLDSLNQRLKNLGY